MDDNKIVELYLLRDETAIRQTAEKYGSRLRSLAYGIVEDTQTAEECENDTYMEAWNTIPPTRPDNFMAFLSKITRNLSLRRLEFLTREKRSAAIVLSLDELAGVLPDERFSPEASDEYVGKLISAFLRNQKEDARNVFIRKYFFFDSIREISVRYSFTESKVKNMLFRTRNKLKEYLIKEGIEL